ncbi:glutamate--tRNA ligase [Candidatus Collierbacteria bacterium]|nr:glutamate--tRNA ligase [Candidatus Collierbacteria bacterium]
MNQAIVRTRFAPSPTGIPHIGNTRTALYSFLLAKKYQGQFILRIEDTDQKRTVPGSLEKIYEIQDFLGLTSDEDPKKGGSFAPYIQTERLEIYQKYSKELITKGAAYEDEGAVRIRMPKEGYATWHDMVQGKISIPNSEVDDKVLMKSDGVPTYHLAAMIDDHLMEISHIIRGVEYIVSTPVHLKIYEALGWEFPRIAHVPLLLGPDRAKLSKRHGAKSVLEYRDEGYLPEAINNFLFFLGFSYQDNSAVLSLSEMVEIFDENKIQKQNAIFDIQKLNHFNKAWIKRLSDDVLLGRIKPFIKHEVSDELLLKIIPLVKERITQLDQFDQLTKFFFVRPTPADTSTHSYLQSALEVLSSVVWTKEAIETGLVDSANSHGWNRGEYFMSLRLAVAGSKVTPPLTESMLIIGRDEILARISQNLNS